jgi:type I restriction enzyme S subunit
MSELGPLLEEWEVVRLKDKGHFQYGYTTSATEEDTGIKFLRITDIREDGFINWGSVPYGIIDDESIQKFRLSEGDVLFARIGATTGKTCIIEGAIPNAVFASYLIRFVPNKELHPKYVFYFTQTREYQELVNAGKEGKLKKGLSATEFKSFKIPLPPLPEQRSIASVLSTAQHAKEKTDAVITATKALKKSLMRHLFTYGPIPLVEAENVPLKETEIGMVPEVWDVVEVENIGEIITGRTPSTKKSEYYGSSHMFISPADIHEGRYVTKTNKRLSEKGLKVSRPLPRYTILVVCIGATIGKTAMTFVDNCTTNQQINAIISKGNVDPSYLYYSLNFHSHRLYPLAGGIGIPIINKSNFGNFKIPLPPPSIQQKIASTLSAVDKKIEAEENKKKALDELFKTLLHNLMTGKLRANHLEV